MKPLATIGRFALFVGAVVRATLTHRPPVGASFQAAYEIGIRSLPILIIISTFVGTNLALQGYNAFKPLGGQSLVGMFVALAGVREMAPIMVAAMVAAKAGTEMASQIAVMRIQEQIDALEVMAVNPYWYLVTPRFAGILLVLPALTIISVATLLLSSYSVSVFQLGLNGEEFLSYVQQTMSMMDFVYTSIKSIVFGAIICMVSCFYGFYSSPGANGVGAATNASVVVSAVLCASLNYVLSELLYG